MPGSVNVPLSVAASPAWLAETCMEVTVGGTSVTAAVVVSESAASPLSISVTLTV